MSELDGILNDPDPEEAKALLKQLLWSVASKLSDKHGNIDYALLMKEIEEL